MRAVQRARHQRLLVLVQNEDFQFGTPNSLPLRAFRRGPEGPSPLDCVATKPGGFPPSAARFVPTRGYSET
jgi:hypothetical protein